ncbi:MULTISPECIES: hypothetical protein [Mycobacterium]|nr:MULTISPECIES: hypothetical protein [Mycobacterium]UCA22984.1 hypothetical protein LA359_29340 [Mycobacterium kansasii]
MHDDNHRAMTQAQDAIRLAPSDALRREPTITSTDLTAFLYDYVPDGADVTHTVGSATLEFGAARMHYESADTWSTLSACKEWRAELRLSHLDARGNAREVVVGTVQFLILRAGYEGPREVLPLYGPRAEVFTELFDHEWLTPELDEDDDFTAGMPISTVLLVLDATMDTRLPGESLMRPWAIAETIHTMLPTTSGLVVMPALAATAKSTRRLLCSEDIDPDWVRVGCRPLPGHPRFYGQATAYVHLDDARSALAHVRDSTVQIRLQE